MKTFMSIGLMFALVACASKAPEKNPTPANETTDPAVTPSSNSDGGDTTTAADVDGSSGPAVVDAGPKVPTNQAECVAACEAKYPKSAAQNKTLDNTCFVAGTCEPVCDNLVAGKNYQPTVVPDAGPVCDTVKANSYPVSTPSQACSDCVATTPACCNLWIAIFSSDDGKALNACSNTCFSTFKN